MISTRRRFVTASAALLGANSIPLSVARPSNIIHPVESEIFGSVVKEICESGVNEAISNGARYADVRVDHQYRMSSSVHVTELISLGIRTFVNGQWGFASTPNCSLSEAVRVARASVRNAKANGAVSDPVEIDFDNFTGGSLKGHWQTKIIDDPFETSRAEIHDFVRGLSVYVSKSLKADPKGFSVDFVKQDKVFVSSLGHYLTQRLYTTSGSFPFTVLFGKQSFTTSIDTTSIAGAGFEYLRGQSLRRQIAEHIEEIKQEMSLPSEPVDVGRYEMVLDANSVATLIADTIGPATELDRALGYEANAVGTSFINEPSDMLGQFRLASSIVSIEANRTQFQGAATVGWDDDGVKPIDFPIIKDGILVDMQTNAETSSEIGEYYRRIGKPIRSNGCSFAPSSELSPLTHTANLRLVPNDSNDSLDSLVKGVKNGILLKRASNDIDYQHISGMGTGKAFRVRNGKVTARLTSAATLFRTPELWNSIVGVGGINSEKTIGHSEYKGQPGRSSAFSVTATPAVLKETTVIDYTRKA